jgi:hypothetical protein
LLVDQAVGNVIFRWYTIASHALGGWVNMLTAEIAAKGGIFR